MSSKEAVNINF